MSDSQFTFLNKIPDQCGYLVVADGVIVKSEGELSNRETVAAIAEKLLATSRSGLLPNAKFNQMTVNFESHFFTLTQSGKNIFVVKRRPQ